MRYGRPHLTTRRLRRRLRVTLRRRNRPRSHPSHPSAKQSLIFDQQRVRIVVADSMALFGARIHIVKPFEDQIMVVRNRWRPDNFVQVKHLPIPKL
eukprot:COSAG01_NODE_1558_length_9925_cov_6.973743_5_plen_96_part_00